MYCLHTAHRLPTIKIIPEVKLPKPKIYSMTPRKLREYIDKNLSRGFIQPVKSPV